MHVPIKNLLFRLRGYVNVGRAAIDFNCSDGASFREIKFLQINSPEIWVLVCSIIEMQVFVVEKGVPGSELYLSVPLLRSVRDIHGIDNVNAQIEGLVRVLGRTAKGLQSRCSHKATGAAVVSGESLQVGAQRPFVIIEVKTT